MNKLLIALLLFSGCCPKLAPPEITKTSDTVYVAVHDTILIPESNTVYDIDFLEICDSLNKNKGFHGEVVSPTGKLNINVSPDGKGKVTCHEDSLLKVIDHLNRNVTDSVIIKQPYIKEVKYIPVWCKIIAGIAGFEFVLIALMFYLITRK